MAFIPSLLKGRLLSSGASTKELSPSLVRAHFRGRNTGGNGGNGGSSGSGGGRGGRGGGGGRGGRGVDGGGGGGGGSGGISLSVSDVGVAKLLLEYCLSDIPIQTAHGYIQGSTSTTTADANAGNAGSPVQLYKELVGLPLLPLADGSVGVFRSGPDHSVYVQSYVQSIFSLFQSVFLYMKKYIYMSLVLYVHNGV